MSTEKKIHFVFGISKNKRRILALNKNIVGNVKTVLFFILLSNEIKIYSSLKRTKVCLFKFMIFLFCYGADWYGAVVWSVITMLYRIVVLYQAKLTTHLLFVFLSFWMTASMLQLVNNKVNQHAVWISWILQFVSYLREWEVCLCIIIYCACVIYVDKFAFWWHDIMKWVYFCCLFALSWVIICIYHIRLLWANKSEFCNHLIYFCG